jgi:hypothetical protein
MAETLVESGTAYPADILLLEEHLAVHPHDKAAHASLTTRLIESGFLHEVQLHIEAALPSSDANFNFIAGSFFINRRVQGQFVTIVSSDFKS